MTKKKEAGATPRQYDAAFKAEAVRLWQSSQDSAEKTAHELGISVFNLYKWKREGAAPRAAGALRPSASKEELQIEVDRLQRELTRMTEQRDILKKVLGIFSEDPSQKDSPQ